MATKKRSTRTSSKKRAGRKSSPRKSSPRKSSPRKSSPRKSSPRKSSPRKSSPRKKAGGRKYGAAASKKVGRAMHERKRGKLRSGSGKKVTSRKQAVAIGLSQARKRGAKLPKKKGARKGAR